MALAKNMADAGHEVIILNRDIKFGGLAEYGIFPSKLKLRGGLKKQYWEMLEQPNVRYLGNVSVGQGKDLSVEDLRGLGASAIAFSIGAQGTKAIGVEGDSAKGVFHAKDVVYHFNRLPGFGDRPFDMGKHVAVIGVGDVMVDIAHWLIRYKKVERVTAIARRGPVERKYNPKEIRAVCANMDMEGIAKEFARIKDRLAAVGQNADEVLASMTAEFTKCEATGSPSKMGFRFLASPKRVLVDADNRVRALEMEENKLEPKGDDTAAVGLKQLYEFPVDSVVFAVGDKVDETVGLPYKNGVFVTNPNKTGNDPDDAFFQAYDEKPADRRRRLPGRLGTEGKRRVGGHCQTGWRLVRGDHQPLSRRQSSDVRLCHRCRHRQVAHDFERAKKSAGGSGRAQDSGGGREGQCRIA